MNKSLLITKAVLNTRLRPYGAVPILGDHVRPRDRMIFELFDNFWVDGGWSFWIDRRMGFRRVLRLLERWGFLGCRHHPWLQQVQRDVQRILGSANGS